MFASLEDSMPKSKPTEKKKSAARPRGVLRSVVAGGATAGSLLELADSLGLADIVVDRIKQRIEGTDVDELLEDVTDYLRKNPEVLVVSLGAITVATGLLVWLNDRRAWNGSERRTHVKRAS
jgi:hypothetical protein